MRSGNLREDITQQLPSSSQSWNKLSNRSSTLRVHLSELGISVTQTRPQETLSPYKVKKMTGQVAKCWHSSNLLLRKKDMVKMCWIEISEGMISLFMNRLKSKGRVRWCPPFHMCPVVRLLPELLSNHIKYCFPPHTHTHLDCIIGSQ